MVEQDVEGQSVTYSCGRSEVPEVRLIHYNDVYHIEYVRHHQEHICIDETLGLVLQSQ